MLFFVQAVLVLLVLVLVLICWIYLQLQLAPIHAALELGRTSQHSDQHRDAIFAASFNPVHLGHVMLLKGIARAHSHGTVYAVVGFNSSKHYDVTPEERCDILRKVCQNDPELSNVKPVVVGGYIWRFANAEDAKKHKCYQNSCILYRGIRNWAKDGQEESKLFYLNWIGPLLLGWRRPPEMRFLTAPESGIESTVSSSEIRRRVYTGTSIADLVPIGADKLIVSLYLRSKKRRS